jgi:hypothetical protein
VAVLLIAGTPKAQQQTPTLDLTGDNITTQSRTT